MKIWPFNRRYLYHFCVFRQPANGRIEFQCGTFDCTSRISSNPDYERAIQAIADKFGYERKGLVLSSLSYLGRLSQDKTAEQSK